MMDSYGPLHPSKIEKGVAAAVAATRQKSCNACVRGKRRCDKKAPKCTRCTTKGLDCIYARLPPGASANDVLLESDDLQQQQHRQHSFSSTTPSMAATATEVPDFGSVFVDLPSLAGSSAGNTSPESSLDLGTESDASGFGGTMGGAEFEPMQMEGDMAGFSIADLLASSNPSMGELWDIHNFGMESNDVVNSKLNPPSLDMVPARPVRDLSMYSEECNANFDPLEVYDERSRPGFFFKVFTDLHVSFAQTRSLSFLHPRLYSTYLPKTIMAAFCAATAYANHTSETKGWTVKLLNETAKEIYKEGQKAATPLDKLARVHAVLLMHSMRFLDGDVGMRSAAEKEFAVLEEWVSELIIVRDELEANNPKMQLLDKNHPPSTWEGWLLLENTRRAVLASISFFCLIAILKGEEVESPLWREQLHFTASRHLWEAQTSLDFYRAWREKPKFFIRQMQYKEFWQYAQPDDLDEFTRAMLTTQTGTEAMDHFMSGAATSIPV